MAGTLFRQWFVEESSGFDDGKISDFFVLHRGYDLPIQERIVGEFPIVTSSGIDSFHHEFKIKGPGVVTGRSGQIGNVYLVFNDFWPLNTTLYVSEFKKATPTFAYFSLSH